jgi:hypothetical protein
MKKITFIILITFFSLQSVQQEKIAPQRPSPPALNHEKKPDPISKPIQEIKPKQASPIHQQPQEKKQTPPASHIPTQVAHQSTKMPEAVAADREELKAILSFLPNPDQPKFKLLPALNGIITLVYKETLGIPPSIFDVIKRFYALLQAQTLEADNIVLEHLTEQQKIELNDQIIERCTKSSIWENRNKMFIAESLEYGMSLLKSVHQQEKIIFTYIPSFETAYYSEGYTHIRNGSELVRLSLVLSDDMRERSVAQCEWGKLKTIDQLYAKIEHYKDGEFYILTRKIQTLLKNKQRYPFPANMPLINHNGLVDSTFSHFVYKEKNGRLEIAKHAKLLMNIDKNNHPYLTALGNFIFTYGHNATGPSLEKNPIFHDLFTETAHGLYPTPVFLEMIAIDSIKIINAHLAYLFNTANLEPTIKKLTILEQKKPNILQSFPNILPYIPQDYPTLAAIKEVYPLVNRQTTPQVKVQGFFGSLFHSISHAFKSVFHAIVHTVESVAKDVVNSISDFSQGIFCALAATTLAIFKPSQSAKYFQLSTSDFSSVSSDIDDAISQVGDIIEKGVNSAATLAGKVIGSILQDSKIGANISGFVNSVVDAVINANEDGIDLSIGVENSMVKLSSEALYLCVDGVMAIGNKDARKTFLKEGNNFGKDIVTSILSEVTFVTSGLGAALTGIMKGVAYLSATIVNLIGDIIGDLAGLAGDVFDDGHGIEWLKDVRKGTNKWRRTIIGSLLVVVGIAMALPSGGSSMELAGMGLGDLTLGGVASGALFVVGTGMMAIGTVGDVQQDIQAHKKKKFEDALLKGYSSGIPQEAVAAQACESAAMTEATVQFAAEQQNSERGLVYYQNFLNSQFNNTISTQGSALGSFYKQITAPDPATGIDSSDPGHLYGIKTGRIALNPAGGLYTFNAARNTFAQEIATAPQQTHKTTQNTTFTMNRSSTGLWINQKDLSNVISAQSFEVEVRWKTLYETEGNFYVGIFMSEQVMNIPLLQALNKNYEDALKLTGKNATYYVEKTWENLDTFNRNLLNYNHLSRNLIIFRENDLPPALGLYQHDGKNNGWISRDIRGVTYQRGVWYRMKMGIDQTTTRFKCWEEGNSEPTQWTTFTLPQAHRSTTIQPIMLPNDKDPFELIVTPPRPPAKKPVPQQEHTASTKKLGAGVWDIKAGHDAQPQSKQWHVTAGTETQPQTKQWHVTAGQDTQVKESWTVSGKIQKAKSANITSALGSLGMITSGVAVEYQIISPATVIEVMPARKKVDTSINNNFKQESIMLIEKDREKQWLLKHGTAEPSSHQSAASTQSPESQVLDQQSVHNTQTPILKSPKTTPQVHHAKKPAAPAKPEHSTFWYLQHGQSAPPAQKNINEKISKDGKYSSLGGPN